MQYRRIQAGELDKAAVLADKVFEPGGGRSMRTMFPSLFSPGVSHSYAAFADNGEIAGFMGLSPSIIRILDTELPVFQIGAVCTDPAYRGGGIAGTLLRLCQEHAARAGASLVFVSGERPLYTRGGCVPFGRIYTAKITRKAAGALEPAAADLILRPMEPADLLGVRALLGKREAGHVHSPGELGQLLGAAAYAGVLGTAQRTLVAVRDGSIEGFAAVGIPAAGAEPRGTAAAIEWAGRPEAAAALLAKAARCNGVDALEARVPWQEQALLGLLEAAGAEIAGGANSGTVCIADREALLRQTAPLLGAAAETLAAAGDDRRLISLLFDPESPDRQEAPGFTALPLPHLYGINFI